MTFLIILITATIELLITGFASLRSDRWVADWRVWLEALCGRWRWWHGPAGLALTFGLPLAAVAMFFAWLERGPILIVGAAQAGLLLLLLGPRDLNREIERYLVAYARGATDDEASAAGRAFLDEQDTGATLTDAGVLQAILRAAHDWLFAPCFWFAVAGPIGPVAYRMAAALRAARTDDPVLSALTERVLEVLIWAPVRLFVIALGLAGTLMPVLEAWRRADHFQWGASERLLADAGLAAAGHGRLEQVIGDDPRVYWINSAQALVKRTFTLSLGLLAATTLMAM